MFTKYINSVVFINERGYHNSRYGSIMITPNLCMTSLGKSLDLMVALHSRVLSASVIEKFLLRVPESLKQLWLVFHNILCN